MAKKVKRMLKNNMVLCVLVLAAIGLTSIAFAADVIIKGGAVTATKVDSLAASTDANDAARKQYVDDNIGSGSGAKQIVNTTTGAKITCIGTIPYDDTVPQNTESPRKKHPL